MQTARGELALRRDGAHFEIISNGVFLMDTRDGRSERLLATAALDLHPAPRRVLVGGLGVGFTLGAVLADPRVAAATVVEVEPAIVGWQHSTLAAFSGRALNDPRVDVVVADLADHLASSHANYDVICLDVDNGPDWTVTETNDRLYSAAGTSLLLERLDPAGVLAVWSSREVPEYEEALRARFAHVAVHLTPREERHPDVVYVAGSRPAC